jgi:hypothetical protein
VGGGKLIALPLSTPPETGFRIRAGATGGGGSESRWIDEVCIPVFDLAAPLSTDPRVFNCSAVIVEAGSDGEVLLAGLPPVFFATLDATAKLAPLELFDVAVTGDVKAGDDWAIFIMFSSR